MNPAEFLDALEDENRTELSRLGSSKSLYALTGGELDAEHVYAVVGTLATAQADRYEAWVAEADGELAEALSAAAAAEREQASDAAAETDDDVDVDGGVYAGLADAETPVERAAGLVGATVVGKKLQEQLVGFFVGQADPTTAGTFRSYGTDLDERREAALAALDAVADDDEDWDAALETAGAVVEAAYDVYVDRLEAMGVNPKPVC